MLIFDDACIVFAKVPHDKLLGPHFVLHQSHIILPLHHAMTMAFI